MTGGWTRWVHWAEYWYNTTFQRSLGISPFQAVYGRMPPPLMYYGDRDTSNSCLDEQLKARDEALVVLKEHHRIAQEKMKKNADLKRRDVEYAVGDMVFLKIRPYSQISLRKKKNEKLSPKFFHVSQLKKMLGDHKIVQADMIPCLTENYEWLAIPEEIYGYTKNKEEDWEVLIKWYGLTPHEATWEKFEDFKQLFLDFHLEDKLSWERECNDRPLSYVNIVEGRRRQELQQSAHVKKVKKNRFRSC